MSVSQLDIWRAANQMMKRYGKRANIEAATRANSALDQGDTANYETWQWVCMAIQELERKRPLEGETVN